MLIHENYVFELQIEMKFQVSDPGKWSKINIKKTARITQSSKLRFIINTWLSYISINEDNAQLTKGYYQIATISSIRSTIVASVTSLVNHRLRDVGPLSCV